MVSDLERLDLTAKEIELIEAALHTQTKILSVQSEAGGCGARQKLSELQRLTKRIGAARTPRITQPSPSLAQLAMSLLHPHGGATTSN